MRQQLQDLVYKEKQAEQLVLSLVLGLVCNANHKKWKKLGGPACQAGFQTRACAAVAAGLDSPSASEAGACSHEPEPFPGCHTQSPGPTQVRRAGILLGLGHRGDDVWHRPALPSSSVMSWRKAGTGGRWERMSPIPVDAAELNLARVATQGRR